MDGQGPAVLPGRFAPEAAAGCGFLRRRPEGGVDYRYAATRQDAQALPAREGWLWDTGIVMGRAGDFLAQVRRFCPGLCETLEERLPRLELSGPVQPDSRFLSGIRPLFEHRRGPHPPVR